VESQTPREELFARFSNRYSKTKYVERAIDTVLEGRVKKHLFVPSGRVLYSVVGRSGDEFIDPEKPFCTCQHYFFSVLGGRDETCYHLLANSIASEVHMHEETRFYDEEYQSFLRLLTSDILTRLGTGKRQPDTL
jgi:predicted nucleic acid-binding Zn finger protein